MSATAPLVEPAAASVLGEKRKRVNVDDRNSTIYIYIPVPVETPHQQLARAWGGAAEASGVLDFMRDDPLLNDYD